MDKRNNIDAGKIPLPVNGEQRPDDMPIFCYECRSRYSFKVNLNYILKDYQTEWVCKVCGHKTWRKNKIMEVK
jgi:hypothetical protein